MSYQEDNGVTKKDCKQITKAMKKMSDQIGPMPQEQVDHMRRQNDHYSLFDPMSASLSEEMNKSKIENMRLDFQKTSNDLMRRFTYFHTLLLEKLLEDGLMGHLKVIGTQTELAYLRDVAEMFEDMFDTFKTQLGVLKNDAMDLCEPKQMRCDAAIKALLEVKRTALDGRCEEVCFKLTNKAVAIRQEVMDLCKKFNSDCDDAVKSVKEQIVKKVLLENEGLVNSVKQELTRIQKHNLIINDVFEEKLGDIQIDQEDFVEKFANRLMYNEYLSGDHKTMKPLVFVWRIKDFRNKLSGFMNGSLKHLTPEKRWYFGDGIFIKPKLLSDRSMTMLLIQLDFEREGGLGIKAKPLKAFLHTRRYILLDQCISDELVHIEIQDVASFKMNNPYDLLISTFNNCELCGLWFLANNTRFMKKDEVALKIILEPIAYQANRLQSVNGVLEWKIDDYRMKKREEIEGGKIYLKSPPFSTSPQGYCMQLELFLNGDEDYKGDYLSLYFHVILSEFDNNLPVPFRCKITAILVDQTGNEDLIKVEGDHTFKLPRMHFSFLKFALQNVAEGPKYLKDNTIIVKTMVEILRPYGPMNCPGLDNYEL